MRVMMHNLYFNNTSCQLNAKQYRESIKTKRSFFHFIHQNMYI